MKSTFTSTGKEEGSTTEGHEPRPNINTHFCLQSCAESLTMEGGRKKITLQGLSAAPHSQAVLLLKYLVLTVGT